MDEQATVRFESPGEPPLAVLSAWLIDESNAQLVAQFTKLDDHTAALDLGSVSPGRYWLSCSIANHPVLRFTVQIKGDAERTISFAGRPPRCATIIAKLAKTGATGSRRIHTINFALPPQHSEVILLAGFDYRAEKGRPSDYTIFARQWRDDIYYGLTDVGAPNHKIDRAIRDHTVVSIFDFVKGIMKQQIRGVKGWHDMYEAMCGTARPHLDSPQTDQELRKSTDSISMTHVYSHISDVGSAAPGSIQELHFYSHAYTRGPVLSNTDDDNGPRKPERDPGDKDPRPKDLWNANKEHWPHLAAAFATGAIVKSWGCYHDDYLKERILAVMHTKSKQEMVKYNGEMINRDMVMFDVADEASASYVMAAVNHLGAQGYAAAPGTTAGYKPGTNYIHVDQSSFGSILGWYEKYFGGRRDVAGHFPYAALKLPKDDDE